MATVNIGNIKFTWQGAYNSSTAYAIDDVVSYNGSSYVCILASTGNLPTNTTYWNVMAQGGTDITSISGLAQGDLLYYNGTAWVRLGAGTNGQALITGGTGANPSWGDVSGDYVKLGSVDTSGVTAVNMDNYFSTDYYHYEFVGSALGVTDNHTIRFNPRNGANNITANRRETVTYNWRNYTGSSTNLSIDSNSNHDNGASFGWVKANTDPVVFRVQLADPQNTSIYKTFKWEASSNDNSYIYYRNGTSVWRPNTNAITGVRFFNSDGSNTHFKITLFGIKK